MKLPQLGKDTKIRINPKGHKERVVKKDGDIESTLNELDGAIERIVESEALGYQTLDALSPEQQLYQRSVNGPYVTSVDRPNNDTITNMSGSTPRHQDFEAKKAKSKVGTTTINEPERPAPKLLDNKDNTRSVSEMVTGTASIGMVPGFSSGRRKKKKVQTEDYEMTRRILKEYAPDFAAGEYAPGDANMISPSGEGVAKRTAKKMGKSNTSMSNHGDAFGAKHNETAAMCDVEESGVEDEPQGKHESKHGDPLADDCCDELGHDWPAQPKHSGGSAEAVEGTRYQDGGVLKGVAEEGWSPKLIGKLMGETRDVYQLFDAYAASTRQICLADFSALCEANDIDIAMDETSLKLLMANDKRFMFEESHIDDQGNVIYVNTGLIKEYDDDEENFDPYMSRFDDEEDEADDYQVKGPESLNYLEDEPESPESVGKGRMSSWVDNSSEDDMDDFGDDELDDYVDDMDELDDFADEELEDFGDMDEVDEEPMGMDEPMDMDMDMDDMDDQF